MANLESAEILVDKAARAVVKDILYHFKVDKWPLSWSVYSDEIVYKAFGVNVEAVFLRELRRKGLDIEFDSDSILIVKHRRKKCRKKQKHRVLKSKD